MWSPTPPESLMVTVSLLTETTQDSVLSIRFPFLVNLKQSTPVITAGTMDPEVAGAVAVDEMGAFAGTYVAVVVAVDEMGASAGTYVAGAVAVDEMGASVGTYVAVAVAVDEMGASAGTSVAGAVAVNGTCACAPRPSANDR